MKAYRIHVLREDIDTCRYQRQGDPRRCMISDAVQRAIPDALFIDTDLRYLRFSLASTERRYFYDLPQVAQRALKHFDEGREVQPFSFTITRGYSVKQRSKQSGFTPKPKRGNQTKTRRQPPRRRQFGLHAFD